jgi:pyruvate dehydrogenase E2 component (dihydrolipoamide acetyltransferase)
MATQVLVPVMGEAIGEARLAAWLKRVGDPVRRGDELAELETDKATLTLECPADGLLLEVLIDEGAMVTTGQLLAQVGRPGEHPPIGHLPAELPARQAADPAAVTVESGSDDPPAAPAGERRQISPAARRLARQLGIDIAGLSASKPGARITTQDVIRLSEAGAVEHAGSDRLPQRRVLLNEIQRVMGARMAQSAREIPQFSVGIEADATRLLQVKQLLSSGGTPVSFTALLILLAARVLRQHPLLNARYDDDAVILFETVNMGVAVTSPQGLVVPVLHGAEHLDAPALARRLEELVQTARSGRLALGQVSDGTFTLSNLGMYGVSQFVPLVNPPQVAILGVAGIQPLVLPAAAGTRHIQRMSMTVSADHRVVDGAAVASFLQDLRHNVEEAIIA